MGLWVNHHLLNKLLVHVFISSFLLLYVSHTIHSYCSLPFSLPPSPLPPPPLLSQSHHFCVCSEKMRFLSDINQSWHNRWNKTRNKPHIKADLFHGGGGGGDRDRERIKTTKTWSLICLVKYSWEWSLPWSMVDTPGSLHFLILR